MAPAGSLLAIAPMFSELRGEIVAGISEAGKVCSPGPAFSSSYTDG